MVVLLLLIPLSTRDQASSEAKAIGDAPSVEEWVPPWDFGSVSTAQSFD